MKKLFILMLALVASLGSLFASNTQVDGIWYNFNSKTQTASVTYRGTSYSQNTNEYTGSVVIPSYVEYNSKTYSVTSIGSSAFRDCSTLTSVTIPSSVTSIGDYAFYGCSGLTSVILPSDITNIGERTFRGCTGLISITIPDSVTSIGSSVFEACSGLTSVIWNAKNCTLPSSIISAPFYAIRSQITSFTFGEEVETIPAYLCYGMEKLTSIIIPNSVTCIGERTFSGCSGLTSIEIPNSVISIGGEAFYDCSKLFSPSIPSSVTTIGSSAFHNIPNIVYSGEATGSPWGAKMVNGYVDGYLVYYDNTETKIMSCSPLITGEIIIPSTVTQINHLAFNNCTGLTAVHISDLNQWCSINFGVKETNPLSYAHHLYLNGQEVVDLTIPSTITTIYNSAFYGCYGLKTVTIPSSVTRIWSSAFNECTGLTTVIMPNTVTQIGGMAFYGCSNLTSINISNSVTSIESSAFQGCSALTSIDIPNGVTSIGSYAFLGVRNVNYSGTASGSPWGAKTRNGVVDGFLVYTDNTKTTLSGCSTAATGDVVIPGTVTNIKTSAFDGCKNITSVTIPESMNTIEASAFQYCTALTSVHIADIASWCNISFGSDNANPLYYAHHLYVGENEIIDLIIPDGVSSINNRVFYGCSSIESVTIPNTVTNIGFYAFANWSGLTSITCEAANPPTIHSSAFTNISYNIPLYVPKESLELYQSANVWKSFTNIVNIPLPTWHVTFVDYDENLLSEEDVEEGDAATPPASPTREGYTFIGWDKDFSNVTSDMIVTAQYEINRYEVKFLDWNGTVLKSENVDWNTNATAPSNPYRAGYTFTGWDKEFATITSDLEVTAQYELGEDINFTIYFNDKNGDEILSSAVVLKVPAAPEIVGFTFLGWQPVASFITDAIDIQAVYQSNTPTEAPEVVVNPMNPAQKLIRNGNVYILTGDKTYTITGQEVR